MRRIIRKRSRKVWKAEYGNAFDMGLRSGVLPGAVSFLYTFEIGSPLKGKGGSLLTNEKNREGEDVALACGVVIGTQRKMYPW